MNTFDESKLFPDVAWNEFEPEPFLVVDKSIKNNKWEYCRPEMFADTETSWNHDLENPKTWIYQWAFTYNDIIVHGRTPSQLMHCLKKIHDINGLGDCEGYRKYCRIYIHNLSYDWEYIKQWLRITFDRKNEKTLAIQSHKILSYYIDGFEFRCSYLLTGLSLENWGKSVNAKVQKLVGAVDYDVIRYQDSKLELDDYKYMFYDVLSMFYAYKNQMDIYKNLINGSEDMPLTVTGYIRKETKNNFDELDKYKNEFKNTALDVETYQLCVNAFAGGITHGNRFYQGVTVKNKIKHRDFVSHYPSQQICGYCPRGKFELYYDCDTQTDNISIDECLKLAENNCLLIEIIIENIRLKSSKTSLPYAQVSKFQENMLESGEWKKDNGRILSFTGMSLLALTEIDLKWLNKQYKFDYCINKVYTAKKGKFPDWLTKTVRESFYEKTHYKELSKKAKQEHGEHSDEYNYLNGLLMIKKGKFNGIYGMTATNPIRNEYIENDDNTWTTKKNEVNELDEKLKKYYSSKNSFMSYQYGVWTTAQARDELMTFYELIGDENFLYADTDSIFYITNEDIEKRINDKNKEFRDINDKNNYYLIYNNKKFYYNQFDDENENIIKFRFLHAKCYAYITDDDELHSTIAGVCKNGRNGNNRDNELGSIDELEENKTFNDCGGVAKLYITDNIEPRKENINGHEVELATGCIIHNISKTLSYELPILDSWEL